MENQISPKPSKLKCTTLARSMQNFFLSTELADVFFLFEIEEVRIAAHKTILAMASPTFKTMFYGSIPEDGDIKIVDSPSEAFKEFLSTLYCANVTITTKHVANVMYLAEKYLVANSSDVCDQFLKKMVSIDDVIVGYNLAVQYNRIELKKKMEEKLEAKISDQPKAVVGSESLLKCLPETLKHFLQNDGLMYCAKQLFDLCMKWAENACKKSELDPSDMKNRKKELGECFYCIPFYFMDPKKIAQIAVEYKDLFDQDDLIELMAIMSSDVPISLNKFKLKINKVENCNWRWDWISKFPDERRQWIKQHETSSIETCLKAVVVGIKLSMIFHNDRKKLLVLSGIMTVNKEGEDDKILLKQPIEIECCAKSWVVSHRSIKLVKPINLEAETTYIFNIDFDSSWKEQTFFTKKMIGEYSHIVKFLCY